MYFLAWLFHRLNLAYRQHYKFWICAEAGTVGGTVESAVGSGIFCLRETDLLKDLELSSFITSVVFSKVFLEPLLLASILTSDVSRSTPDEDFPALMGLLLVSETMLVRSFSIDRLSTIDGVVLEMMGRSDIDRSSYRTWDLPIQSFLYKNKATVKMSSIASV